MAEKERHSIHWQDSEIAAVCAALRYLVASDKTALKGAAIRQAEEVLPPNRRRLKSSAALYGSAIAKRLNDAYTVGLETTKTELAALHPPVYPVYRIDKTETVPAPVVTQMPPTVHLNHPTRMPAPEPPEPEPASSIEPEMTESRPSDPWGLIAQLAVEIAHDIAERLDRIEGALIARIGPPPGWKPPVTPAAAARAKGQRIAIIGPLKDQFEHVRIKVRHLPYQLIYVDKDDQHYRLPQADYVLVSKHSSHGWYEKARRSDTQAYFVDGAVSGIVQKIMDIHSQRKP